MAPIANRNDEKKKIDYAIDYDKIDIRDPNMTTLYGYDVCDEITSLFSKKVLPIGIKFIDGERSGCQAKIHFNNGYNVCFELPDNKRDKRKLAFMLYGLAVKKGCASNIFYRDKENTYTVSVKHRKKKKGGRLQSRYDEVLK